MFSNNASIKFEINCSPNIFILDVDIFQVALSEQTKVGVLINIVCQHSPILYDVKR